MRKERALFFALALILTQHTFADTSTMMMNSNVTSQQCDNISKACVDAGFTGAANSGKNFWIDCMGPILISKNVSGVTINTQDVKPCREAKIAELQKQLKILKNKHM